MARATSAGSLDWAVEACRLTETVMLAVPSSRGVKRLGATVTHQ
jgi:hypothetical protein